MPTRKNVTRTVVDRKVQKITSPYGRRGRPFHKGVDLRSWNDSFTKKLPIVLPELCIFDRTVYQEKWGWTHVFLPCESGYYEIKFTHMEENKNLVPEMVYDVGKELGYTFVTKYMKSHGLGDHLHFETWIKKGEHSDPEEYFESMDIKYI